jgi:phage terminase large subunit
MGQNSFQPGSDQQQFMESTAKQVMGYGGFGSGKCVHPDTRIRMTDGTHKKITDVRAGDIVRSLDTDTGEMVDSMVRDRMYTGTKECYRVSIADREDVIVSADHPFYTALTDDIDQRDLDAEWVTVSKGLMEGNRVAVEPPEELADSRISFREIESIEHIGERGTYDLEVAITHNFVGNGIVLHNTRTMNEKGYMLNMKYPGNRGLIVRKNFSDVRSSTIEQSLLEDVIPDSHVPDDGWNKSEHRIEHFTGTTDQYGEPVMSEIYYEGLATEGNRSDDALPRRVSGMQFGWIAIDEATETTEGDFVQLLGRLRYNQHEQGGQIFNIPFRQIMVATNPAGPEHYLNRRFLQEPENDVEAFKLRPENNPGIPSDYVQDMKDNYSGVYYERYVEGNWVGTEDVVYDEFDRRRFVLDLKELQEIDEGWSTSEKIGEAGVISPPDDWTVYRVIDFGYPSPTVIQWFAQSPANSEGERMYVMFREVYQSEMMIEDICEQYIKPYSEDVDVDEMYADPAQADSRETLSRRGIETVSANKDVWAGIQEVKAQMDTDSLEHPGVLFYENALVHREDQDLNDDNKPARTVDEFAGYEWSDNRDDEPVKEDDHGMDCMRYLVFTLEGDSGPSYDELEEFANSVRGGF